MYEQGAWIRIYGVPIHAWNEKKFKIYVSGRGIFLKANSGTLENINGVWSVELRMVDVGLIFLNN